jgi:uncharacterized protein (DUF486 family)
MKGIIKILSFFEVRMNTHYRKIFSLFGCIWGISFFFILDVPAQVIKYSILSSNQDSSMANMVISQSLTYGIGLFVFYTMIGATLFIVSGELFVRVCEYFKIDSKLYHYMTKGHEDINNKNNDSK